MVNSPPGGLVIVSSSPARNLDFFDARTGRKLRTIDSLIAQPHEIAWDSKRRFAYITHTYRFGAYGEDVPRAHELSVIDPQKLSIVDTIDISPYVAPHDVEYDAANDLIVIGVERGGEHNGVVLVDPDTRRIAGNIPTEGENCHWLGVTPHGMVFVAHKEAPFISVVDVARRRVVQRINFPGGTEEIDASPDGRFVFVNTPRYKADIDIAGSGMIYKRERDLTDPPPRLVRIDTATLEITGEVEFSDYNVPVRVGSGNRVIVGRWAFATRPGQAASSADLESQGELIVIDGEHMREVGRIPLGLMPFTTRISPDGRTAWVSGFDTGLVSVIDLETMRVHAQLANNPSATLGGTHGLCFVPPAQRQEP